MPMNAAANSAAARPATERRMRRARRRIAAILLLASERAFCRLALACGERWCCGASTVFMGDSYVDCFAAVSRPRVGVLLSEPERMLSTDADPFAS